MSSCFRFNSNNELHPCVSSQSWDYNYISWAICCFFPLVQWQWWQCNISTKMTQGFIKNNLPFCELCLVCTCVQPGKLIACIWQGVAYSPNHFYYFNNKTKEVWVDDHSGAVITQAQVSARLKGFPTDAVTACKDSLDWPLVLRSPWWENGRKCTAAHRSAHVAIGQLCAPALPYNMQGARNSTQN